MALRRGGEIDQENVIMHNDYCSKLSCEKLAPTESCSQDSNIFQLYDATTLLSDFKNLVGENLLSFHIAI